MLIFLFVFLLCVRIDNKIKFKFGMFHRVAHYNAV